MACDIWSKSGLIFTRGMEHSTGCAESYVEKEGE